MDRVSSASRAESHEWDRADFAKSQVPVEHCTGGVAAFLESIRVFANARCWYTVQHLCFEASAHSLLTTHKYIANSCDLSRVKLILRRLVGYRIGFPVANAMKQLQVKLSVWR